MYVINNAPVVFDIGTQEKIQYHFLSKWVKDSRFKMLIFVDFRPCVFTAWVLLSGYDVVPDGSLA